MIKTSMRARGGFVTVLVLAALAVAGVAFVALRGHVSLVHRRTADHKARTLAELLAESALEEAHAATGRMVNDPEAAPAGREKLFDRFRTWGDQGGADALSTSVFSFQVPLPRTRELASQAPFAAGRFDISVDSRVTAQAPLLRANDRAGLVVHRATVRHAGVETVVERQYGFRVSLVTAMRPYERVTLVVQDGASFFKGERDEDPGLADVAEGLALKWAKLGEVRREAVRALHLAAEEHPVDGVDPDAGLPDDAVLRAIDRADPELAEAASQLAARTRALEQQGYVMAIHSTRRAAAGEARVELAELDWPRAMSSDLDAAAADAGQLVAALAALKSAAASVTTTEGAAQVKALAATAADDARALDQSFRRTLTCLARVTKDLRAFTPQEQQVRAEFDKTRELLDPVAWLARTYLRVDAADRRQSDGTLADYLRRRGHPAKAANGIVLWNNPGEPLKIDRLTFTGMLVVVATGDVEVSEVRKADANSLLTVVALGRLTVRGTVQASLIAPGQLEIASGTRIEGNLVAREWVRGMDAAVALDHKLSGGWGPANPADEKPAARRRYYVSLSPGPLATSVRS